MEGDGKKTESSTSSDPDSRTGDSSTEVEKKERQSQSKEKWQTVKQKKQKAKKSKSDKTQKDKPQKEKEVKKPQNLQPFERLLTQTKAKQPTPSPSTGEWPAFKIPRLPPKPVKSYIYAPQKLKDIRIDTQPYSLPRGEVAERGGRGGQNARSTSRTRKDSVSGRGGRGRKAQDPSPQRNISYRCENPDYRIAARHDRKASLAGSGGQSPRGFISKAPKLEFNWPMTAEKFQRQVEHDPQVFYHAMIQAMPRFAQSEHIPSSSQAHAGEESDFSRTFLPGQFPEGKAQPKAKQSEKPQI